MSAILHGLNEQDAQEAVDLMDYCSERLNNNGGYSPEGNAAAILNGASPAVRRRFQAASEFIETPRHKPFEQKRSEQQNMDLLGLDVPNASVMKDAIDGLYVAGKLQERMGVDKPDTSPPSLRESISASFDATQQGAEA